MGDSQNKPSKKMTFYGRIESRVLSKLPAFITPLRFKVLLGYTIVLMLTIYGWEQLEAAWRYILTLLAPAFALIGALMALKLGVVFVSLFTLATALIKFFFGFLLVVLKPGILKAIFIPQLLSFAAWIHRKSARLQDFFKKIYNYFKSCTTRLVDWWKAQKRVDKILLAGFLVPLLVILLLVFVIERAVSIFAVKKISEQVVQKTTKLIIKYFHKIPVIGSIPSKVAQATRRLTVKDDRDDVVEDFQQLSQELYPQTDGTLNKQSIEPSNDKDRSAS